MGTTQVAALFLVLVAISIITGTSKFFVNAILWVYFWPTRVEKRAWDRLDGRQNESLKRCPQCSTQLIKESDVLCNACKHEISMRG